MVEGKQEGAYFALPPGKIGLSVTFCKNDTESSNLIFDPLRLCSCLFKIIVLVRN